MAHKLMLRADVYARALRAKVKNVKRIVCYVLKRKKEWSGNYVLFGKLSPLVKSRWVGSKMESLSRVQTAGRSAFCTSCMSYTWYIVDGTVLYILTYCTCVGVLYYFCIILGYSFFTRLFDFLELSASDERPRSTQH